MKTIIRNATKNDIDDILSVEKKVWGENSAKREMIISRLHVYPEGSKVAIIDDQIVGVVFTEIIDGHKKFKNWYEYTDNGYIKTTHNNRGDTIFGVGLSVLKEYSNRGIGTDLLLSVGQDIIKKGLKGGILGGRIPYYYKYKDKMSIEDYINFRDNRGKLIDPEIRFYKKAGFAIKKIVPDYFKDSESDNYGLLIEWKNPFYFLKSDLSRKAGANVFTVLFRIKNKFNR